MLYNKTNTILQTNYILTLFFFNGKDINMYLPELMKKIHEKVGKNDFATLTSFLFTKRIIGQIHFGGHESTGDLSSSGAPSPTAG